MTTLFDLKNSHRPRKKVQRVGRGIGSKRGKTSCRGHKGYGSRRGSTKRLGYEGGQMRLFRKLPCRGFTRGRFKKEQFALNLATIDELFSDGETVSFETLLQKGILSQKFSRGIKILSQGSLEKKVSVEAQAFSKEAIRKLEEKKIPYKITKLQ